MSRAREELLIDMLTVRLSQWDMSGLTKEGFEKAFAVVREWRGMFDAPPDSPKDAPPPADVGCCDEAAS